MHMRRSRVLQKLRNGEVVSCFKINLDSARAVELAAMAGFDCIWLCTEHIAADWSLIEKQVWAAKSQDADVVVRVARGSYSDYVRPLEIDATGIMVPHAMSLADAQEVVRMTRFHPLGLRALDGGNADGQYAATPPLDYMSEANTERFVILQIEDPEALEEIDAIAALPGVDMLFFGPGDFSQAIGAPAQWDDPRIQDARVRVAEACRKHGKFAGTVGGLANRAELIKLGYRFISTGADVLGLRTYCDNFIDEFKKADGRTDTAAESDSIYK